MFDLHMHQREMRARRLEESEPSLCYAGPGIRDRSVAYANIDLLVRSVPAGDPS